MQTSGLNLGASTELCQLCCLWIAKDTNALYAVSRTAGFDAQILHHVIDTNDRMLQQADSLVITTAWPEFADVRHRTDKPVVDCRYML